MTKKNLPDSVACELQTLAAKLKGQASARRVWEQVLAPDEQEEMPLAEFCKKHCVEQFVQLRCVSHARAVLDVAHGIDLLSTNQYNRLLRDIGEVDCHPTGKPFWNADTCELTFRGQVVRKIRGRNVAVNVCQILDVFQEDGWPDRIDDPLTDGPNANRVRETIRSLNDGLTLLKFRADGSGEGILWEIA
ncbi:MAG: hypothetical protein ACYC6N_25375 [Pirellulaceae bacterium]